jgi:hypothetical protein
MTLIGGRKYDLITMMQLEEAPPRRVSLRDAGMLLLCLGLGVWLLTYGQKEWGDDSLYRVKTKLLGPEGMVLSDEIKTGREMNRNRMIFGVVSLAYGGYLGWKILKSRSRPPENNARDVT